MMVVWKAGAIANRRAAIANIAEHDIQAARNQLFEILKQTDLLALHPKLGRPSRRRPGTRRLSIVSTRFVITYRIRPRAKRIEILRFEHTRRNRPVD